jgi:Ni,Fe-hydrogenase III large subunit
MSGWQERRVTGGRVAALADKLAEAGIAARRVEGPAGPAPLLEVDAEAWGRVAEIAVAENLRWCSVWGDHQPPRILVTSLLFGLDGHLLLRTAIPETRPKLTSQAPFYPAADRPERSLQDMFGVRFTDQPDGRRWIRHLAWRGGQHPLRREFLLAGRPEAETAPDCEYPFRPVEGEGVSEIPVGPVHAGIIEPGHFRFQAVGETILSLEEHLGYVHRGVEKLAEGRDLAGLARLAGRVSGDSTVAHAWAACQAAERALKIQVPPRALALRAIMAERERIANHLGDIGAVCNDVAFSFAFAQFGRLRELWQRQSNTSFGHRLMMDRVVPGGVACNLAAGQKQALLAEAAWLRGEVAELLPFLLEYPSLQDRLRETGILDPDIARRFGTLGYVGRASNLQDDLRRDAPYPPYDRLTVEVPAFFEGDVARRVQVRGDEILVSLGIIGQLLQTLPEGAIRTACEPMGKECEGLGLVEGWRGEIVCYLRLDAQGRVLRYFPRDPSWLNWPALELLIDENIVPDFPVCNKSVNGSYAGHDL